MELVDHTLKVAPTAALVLYHARSLYESGPEKTYLSKIDFSEIQQLSEKMEASYKDFDYTVLCRKRFVRYLLDQYLSEDAPVQVCILGAGLDPISLHLLQQYDHAVSGIFEVDMDHLGIKQKLYERLLPDNKKIHFIQADITDTLHLLDRLRDAGYSPAFPTLVIFEGLLPYIGDEHFLNIMQLFRTVNKTNVVLMDYILPEEYMPESTLPAWYAVKKGVEAFIGGSLYSCSRQQIFNLVAVLHGDVASVDSMQDVEFKLNGRNEVYYEDGEGLIEMVVFYL
ncbi:class I SAM-dependent methyltransferase [Chitinophaga niabensis]|uniref:Leucine carboxyl methyltransferase n=1 Tax=Chitinophaga niabensis TaxID=536979 RepID=A0A1N6J8M3_9BACT|nr:class I SAM-dependent methyltransferase [Chitinophaga niabensis]SIO40476.1 Leucine carboxyl methyltransferase [Chitinophaga niabensis]